jgi:hypothetical protein
MTATFTVGAENGLSSDAGCPPTVADPDLDESPGPSSGEHTTSVSDQSDAEEQGGPA